MEEIILYSTDCPKCQVLTKKMEDKKIQYEKRTSIDEMLCLGIQEVPVLSVNGKLMNFNKAIKWINNKVNDE